MNMEVEAGLFALLWSPNSPSPRRRCCPARSTEEHQPEPTRPLVPQHRALAGGSSSACPGTCRGCWGRKRGSSQPLSCAGCHPGTSKSLLASSLGQDVRLCPAAAHSPCPLPVLSSGLATGKPPAAPPGERGRLSPTCSMCPGSGARCCRVPSVPVTCPDF